MLLKLIYVTFFLSGITIISAFGATYSDLWGTDGEKWTPESRLPDVSYAGFKCGEETIPVMAVKSNVRDFGAKGDSLTDDTKAFINAITATDSGAILIPAGVYKITNFITIDKPNVVLRGEGSGKSVLWFPSTLTDVLEDWGSTTTGDRTSNYSWAGGYIVFSGSYNQQTLATVTAVAKRGDTSISVSTTTGFTINQWIDIQVKDDASKSLVTWLYNNNPGSISSLNVLTARMVSRIKTIDTAGKRISLDRPLRFETRPSWTPIVRRFKPSVYNCGVEELGFKFPETPYQGEFKELGYNAINILSATHCWVRNVHFENAEGGIFCKGMFCTMSGVVLTATKAPFTINKYMTTGGCAGHHGISVSGTDNLVTNFDFRMSYVHDLSVEDPTSAGNVFSNGRGDDLCFDNHKEAPHGNVYSDLDCGKGNRIWRCGGGANLGLNCGGWSTWWNIRAAKNLSYPVGFGPWSINLVGLTTGEVTSKQLSGKWFETMKPEDLVPQNIHEAQTKKRLAGDTLSTVAKYARHQQTALNVKSASRVKLFSLSGRLLADIENVNISNTRQFTHLTAFSKLSAGLYLYTLSGFDNSLHCGLIQR
jgi:hypothetical protein